MKDCKDCQMAIRMVLVNGRKLSYSRRCSLMGNGWNEPTVEWILSRLKENIVNDESRHH